MIYLCIVFVFLGIGIGMSNHKNYSTSWKEYDLTIFELHSTIKKANAGDATAAYTLGMYYYLVENNDKESLLWFERSAANDFPPALYELIIYYGLISDRKLQRKGKEYYDKLNSLKEVNNLAANYYDKLSDGQKIMFE